MYFSFKSSSRMSLISSSKDYKIWSVWRYFYWKLASFAVDSLICKTSCFRELFIGFCIVIIWFDISNLLNFSNSFKDASFKKFTLAMNYLVPNFSRSKLVSIKETSKFRSKIYFLRSTYCGVKEYAEISLGWDCVIVNGAGGTTTTLD